MCRLPRGTLLISGEAVLCYRRMLLEFVDDFDTISDSLLTSEDIRLSGRTPSDGDQRRGEEGPD